MKILLFWITGIFFVFLTLFVSANLEINSPDYSGSLTQGSSGGNITDGIYSGDSVSFYQQAAGYLNDILFQGIHGFSFVVAELTGYVPSLSLTKPENKTYITISNLPLNFTHANSLYRWYNLDNGANTTISGNTTFNTANGQHTLYLFANNTYGNTSTNIVFTVNTTRFFTYYSNYSGSVRGSSTDFNQSTYEDLQNLSGIILENTNFGKIMFNTIINMTNDSTPSDNILNLDSYTNISNNTIAINSAFLPNFNKSATVYLYNLTFTDPRILRDGAVCSASICTEVNYSGGTLVFNVTQFSNYSAEETPVPAAASPGGGGGGGGRIAGLFTGEDEFTLEREQISVSLRQGEVKDINITVTNNLNKEVRIEIENLIPQFVVRGEDVIVLDAGESEIIPLYVIARVDTVPNLYLGKLIISNGNIEKEILVAIEVGSGGVLLDIRSQIEPAYKEILSGEGVLAQIRLFNLGGSSGRKDVEIIYIIKDSLGNEIVREHESLAIDTQASFIKRVITPNGLGRGTYFLYVQAIYDGKTASASDNFAIVTSKVGGREKIFIVLSIFLIIVLSIVIYIAISNREKHSDPKGRVSLSGIMRR